MAAASTAATPAATEITASSSSSLPTPGESTAPSHPDLETDYLPFHHLDQTWADISPAVQDDGPAEVLCGIMYDPAYSSAMDLFRALYPERELSPRALALTTHIVTLNPSNYSIWAYRADILISPSSAALGEREKRLRRELQWMEELARGNMKSYQVWQHRRLILSALQAPSMVDLERELNFIGTVLARDSKNYHTWAYRQWILAQFGGLPRDQNQDSHNEDDNQPKFPQLWEGELPYTVKLLSEDARNNSAWNHRFFAIFGSRRGKILGPNAIGLSARTDSSGTLSAHTNGDLASKQEAKNLEECLEAEVGFTKGSLSLMPSNASAWTYLRGILALLDVSDPQSLSASPSACLNLFGLPAWIRSRLVLSTTLDITQPLPAAEDSGMSSSICLFALEFLLDAIEEAALGAQRDEDREAEVERIVWLLKREDPVRTKWWDVRRREVRRALGLV